MEKRYFDLLQENPVIAAVRDEKGLEKCLQADVKMIFILYGDICSIASIVERVKEAGKVAVVHADLIGGLSGKEVSVEFLKKHTRADGIVSTRINLVQTAQQLGMLAVLRVFLIDSMSLDTVLNLRIRPDAIDILPGLMPEIIHRVHIGSGIPVLTGGLITDKQQVLAALSAGALAVSTTIPEIWDM
ncbi:MAG: glycerol-3-phosphate responsive antiterminator [Oscillospiraceae bacterium]|nr:glycerol-3-phosphate responsive antiterminator [Oscillospiraceae bacterium]